MYAVLNIPGLRPVPAGDPERWTWPPEDAVLDQPRPLREGHERRRPAEDEHASHPKEDVEAMGADRLVDDPTEAGRPCEHGHPEEDDEADAL